MSWLSGRNPFGPIPELIGLLAIIAGYMSREARLIVVGCFGIMFCSGCAGVTLIAAALIIRSR